ncbi:hypothetical protein B0H16DRAFT_1881494 [Mycena metata]|uniref:F-box domain-containing protein n=1 Tax=Mycena metata TaxID=1033252 RepID=A0AAD7JS48_9AGAR|nr:hypothetical protein B0H16DRAFT_1881494 [Mycena metata]
MHTGYGRNTSIPPSRRPPVRSAAGAAALMIAAPGSSWVGPVTPRPLTAPQSHATPRPVTARRSHPHPPPPSNPSDGTNTTPSNKPGAANRIPLEIALEISKYLDVRDLGRAAQAWHSIALASTASPEFIRLECARYSLLLHGSSDWTGAKMRVVRERMQRFNFAWSTLLYSTAQFVNIPQMTASTPWAGSHQWQSGNRFTGESNGYIYDVFSWAVGSQFQARVSIHWLPSLRTRLGGEVTHFDLPLRNHFVKAVAVDPVQRRVAILEFDNNPHARGEPSSFPIVHICTLDGRAPRRSVKYDYGIQPFTEIYHMELHQDMVCFVGNVPSSRHPSGMESTVVFRNWRGARREGGVCVPDFYCTGFQFITEDLYIVTTREKPIFFEHRLTAPGYDYTPYSSLVWVGHVRRGWCNRVTSIVDPRSRGQTENGITLVRNNSPYNRARGPFYSNPATRLFGLKYDYNELDGSIRSSVALFGQTTVESWVHIVHTGPTEPIHWVDVPRTDTADMRLYPEILASLNDTSNVAGWAVIGRRLFWGERWHSGWGCHLVDYSPGAVPAHRKALTGLLLGDHLLSVERLRFCRGGVEDEVHALFDCTGEQRLSELRARFLTALSVCDPKLHARYGQITNYDFLLQLVSTRKGIKLFAKYVYDVLSLFHEFPRFFPVVFRRVP